MNKNSVNRDKLKKLYKQAKLKDGKDNGCKINDLFQALHLQKKIPEENRDKEVIQVALQSITEARKEKRFREEFPTFAKFYQFVTDENNGINLDDLTRL